jgi:hypothetical protein
LGENYGSCLGVCRAAGTQSTNALPEGLSEALWPPVALESTVKKSSGEMIREALFAERKRIIELLESLKRAYYLSGDADRYQALLEAIATIERNTDGTR